MLRDRVRSVWILLDCIIPAKFEVKEEYLESHFLLLQNVRLESREFQNISLEIGRRREEFHLQS